MNQLPEAVVGQVQIQNGVHIFIIEHWLLHKFPTGSGIFFYLPHYNKLWGKIQWCDTKISLDNWEIPNGLELNRHMTLQGWYLVLRSAHWQTSLKLLPLSRSGPKIPTPPLHTRSNLTYCLLSIPNCLSCHILLGRQSIKEADISQAFC